MLRKKKKNGLKIPHRRNCASALQKEERKSSVSGNVELGLARRKLSEPRRRIYLPVATSSLYSHYRGLWSSSQAFSRSPPLPFEKPFTTVGISNLFASPLPQPVRALIIASNRLIQRPQRARKQDPLGTQASQDSVPGRYIRVRTGELEK